MRKLLYFSVIILLYGCNPQDEKVVNEKVMGYRPIYTDYASIRKVEVQASRALKKPGKIYIKDKYLYINEIGEGIHIFDNSDKTHPKPVSFIAIPVNKDISIKNNILYADNADELIAIDITDPKSIKVLKRIEKAFPYPSYPNESGRFECVDPSKGYVKSWEYVGLVNPKCYR